MELGEGVTMLGHHEAGWVQSLSEKVLLGFVPKVSMWRVWLLSALWQQLLGLKKCGCAGCHENAAWATLGRMWLISAKYLLDQKLQAQGR